MSDGSSQPPDRRPWGAWMSLLFGAVIFIVYSTAQGLGLIPMAVLHAAAGGAPSKLAEFALNGLNLALATMVGCPVMLIVCGLLAWARQGPSLGDYLALHRLGWGTLLFWVAVMLGLGISFSLFNDFLKRPPPAFIVQTYATAGYLPLFWGAVAICAPLAEEVMMRGFLFRGLAASRGGNASAILVTTALFTLMHLGQYEWLDLAQIGMVGLLLGLGRARTHSLLAPLAMHIALNLTSLTLYALTAP